MNELCLCNLTVGDAGPLELIDAARAGDFSSVNMWLTEPPAMAHVANLKRNAPPVIGDAALIAAIRRRCEQQGITVFSASCGWIGPAFSERELGPVLEAAVGISARSIAVVGWDTDRARLADHVAAVCEAAAPHGIAVHLEFMSYSALRTIADAQALLGRVRKPNARIIVDALHLARSGGTPGDVARADPSRIASVQLCDAPEESPVQSGLRDESVNGRLLPGEGRLPLLALMESLPREVVVELETPVARLGKSSIDERARTCGDAARRFLDAYAAARPSR